MKLCIAGRRAARICSDFIASSKRPRKTKVHRSANTSKFLHQRSSFGMKFEDRSQKETERQQRCARGKAWDLAKHIFKLKDKDKATFYSPSEERVLPAASTDEPEEREFVVDSGASMHMVSKRDLNSAELVTMRTSRNPTTVMTANGEVQTREETIRPVVRNHLVCRRAPQVHLHVHLQSQYGETRCINQQKRNPPPKMTTKKYTVTRLASGVQGQSGR